MSVDFDDASSQYLRVIPSTFPLSTFPFTLSGWGYPHDATTSGSILSISDVSETSRYGTLVLAGASSDRGNYFYQGTGGGDSAFTVNTFTANNWWHMCGISTGEFDRRGILDGDWDNSGSDVDSNPYTAGMDGIGIGTNYRATPGGFFDGLIAECAIWDAALNRAEVEALAAGYSALFIRPQNLVFYAPLINNFNDIVGGEVLIDNGADTSFAEHPPIIYPTGQQVYPISAASVIPQIMHHRRQQE